MVTKIGEFKISIDGVIFTADRWDDLVVCDGEFEIRDTDNILHKRFIDCFNGEGIIRKKIDVIFCAETVDFTCKFFGCVLKNYITEEKKVVLHYDCMQSPHIINGKYYH